MTRNTMPFITDAEKLAIIRAIEYVAPHIKNPWYYIDSIQLTHKLQDCIGYPLGMLIPTKWLSPVHSSINSQHHQDFEDKIRDIVNKEFSAAITYIDNIETAFEVLPQVIHVINWETYESFDSLGQKAQYLNYLYLYQDPLTTEEFSENNVNKWLDEVSTKGVVIDQTHSQDFWVITCRSKVVRSWLTYTCPYKIEWKGYTGICWITS